MNSHQDDKQRVFEEVTVAIITYNGREYLEEVLEAVEQLNYEVAEVLLVDNNSSDATVAFVKERFPDVRIIELAHNNGPNPARNTAIRAAKTDKVFLVDHDATVSPDSLSLLMSAAAEYPEAAIWAPRVVYHDRPETIQLDGIKIHYIGEAILEQAEEPVESARKDIYKTDCIAGIALLVSKEKVEQAGYYDEDYFLGKDDGEFSFRCTLLGLPCYVVPLAVVRHKVKKRGFSQIYLQVRNRWYFILTYYNLRTLLLICPALVLHEINLAIFLLMKKGFPEYLKGNLAVLANVPLILRKRRAFQLKRIEQDHDHLHSGAIGVRKDIISTGIVQKITRFMEFVYCVWWKIIKGAVA